MIEIIKKIYINYLIVNFSWAALHITFRLAAFEGKIVVVSLTSMINGNISEEHQPKLESK